MLKHLRNVAHNIAHKFSCSSGYFAKLSYDNKLVNVAIDILNGSVQPAIFDIERNNILIGYCKDNFYQLLNENEKQHLKTAILKGDFYIKEEILYGDFILEIELINNTKIISKVVTNQYY